MILHETRGFIISFGFDVRRQKVEPTAVFWNDPETGSWDPDQSNQAGDFHISAPYMNMTDIEFVKDTREGFVAFQKGLCLEFEYVGAPFVWSVRVLRNP